MSLEHQKEMQMGLMQVIKRFWPFIWDKKRTLGGSYFLDLVAVGALVLSPWPLKIIIDNVLGNDPLPEFLANVAQNFTPETLVILLAFLTVLITLMRVIASSVAKILNAQVREHMGLNLRDRLLCHLQTLPHTLRQSFRGGELVLRLVSDVTQLVRLYTKTLPVIFRHGADIIMTFAVMFWVEPILAGICALTVVLLAMLVKGYTAPLKKASKLKRHREGQTAGLTQEIIRGLPTIQALGIEKNVRKRFRKFNTKSLKAGLNEMRIAVGMERTLSLARGILVGLIVGGGGLLVLKNKITIGELTVFSAYVIRLLKPVEKMSELASSLSRAVARGELLSSLLDCKPTVSESTGEIYKMSFDKPATGFLEFCDVTFAYPSSDSGFNPEPVLKNLDLVLEPGQLTVLTGTSGSGKSTLLYLLLRFLDPSSGNILLDNIEYDRINYRSLRSQFAVMLQDTHLFAGSIRETLCPEDSKINDRVLWDALKLVALDDHVRGLPDRLDTELGEDGVNISGGQRARLSLARAFLLDRPILVLDEPLANVDADSQKIILDALDQIRANRTCLVITHQLSLLDRADVVLRMENGQISKVSDLVQN